MINTTFTRCLLHASLVLFCMVQACTTEVTENFVPSDDVTGASDANSPQTPPTGTDEGGTSAPETSPSDAHSADASASELPGPITDNGTPGDEAGPTTDTQSVEDTVTASGAVEGVVWYSDSSPAVGITVAVIGQDAVTSTGAFGDFSLTNVPAGSQHLLLGPTEDDQARILSIEVPADDKLNAGIVTLEAMGSVEGIAVLVDAIDDDHGGITVGIPGTPFESTSASSGYFQLLKVPSGCAQVAFTRDDYQDREFNVCVNPEERTDVGTVTLYPIGACVPDCVDKVCGDDGCEGTCGLCPNNQLCGDGACYVGGQCGDEICASDVGETCTNCAVDCLCTEAQICLESGCCTPDCSQSNCGDDGCGGSCGNCQPPLTCSDNLCVIEGGSCGDGQCAPGDGENCTTCAVDCGCPVEQTCVLDGTCCTPFCDGIACGDDGCAGSCGSCGPESICESGQCIYQCPEGPEAPDESFTGPLPSVTPAGLTESVLSAGFTDDYLYSGDGTHKIGIRQDWGGAIIYFGEGPNDSNLIDTTHGGRGVGFALRDVDRAWQGCAWNASCVTEPSAACPTSPSFVGWHPRLGTNECGSLPGVEGTVHTEGTLRSTARPLFWNPDWLQSSCSNDGCFGSDNALPAELRYDQQIRFVAEDVAEVTMAWTNLSGMSHGLSEQEVPIIFAAKGPGATETNSVFIDSAGSSHTPDSSQPDGSLTGHVSSEQGWMSLQNTNLDMGIGLLFENGFNSFLITDKDGDFRSLAGAIPFSFESGLTVAMRFYLMRGSYAHIATKASELVDSLAPFGDLESPTPDQVVQGTVPISGWALDNRGVTNLEVLIDGAPVEISRLDYGGERQDVCARWPGYPDCGFNGFTGSASLAGLSPCAHLVEVRATDTDGNNRIIASVRIQVESAGNCEDVSACDDGDSCTIESCDPLLGCVQGPKPIPQLTTEVCNNLDDNCDGQTDESPAAGCITYFEDGDSDTFGSSNSECLCSPTPPFTALLSGDCADDNSQIYPNATESCNGLDDDCDNQTDEEGATGCVTWYEDIDNDGWGQGEGACLCEAPGGDWTATQAGDCDDNRDWVNPNATEICNLVDDDCNDATDENGACPEGAIPIFRFRWLEGEANNTDQSLGTDLEPPAGYALDGVVFRLFAEPADGLVALEQSYCAMCTDHLPHVGAPAPWYLNASTLGYCSIEQTEAAHQSLTLYRHEIWSDHTATSDATLGQQLLDQGYSDAGILCWVP